MKRILICVLMLIISSAPRLYAQQPDFHGGFQNIQPPVEPDFKDVNYANDTLEAHRMDIYLPKTGKAPYPAVVAIYGSAWYSNNMKAITYFSMGKPLLEAGFAVICINHRSSADDKFPAQLHDVKGAIRFVRANAKKYKIDPKFMGITGFSSGGHLASMAGVTNNATTRKVQTFQYDAKWNKLSRREVEIYIEGEIGGNTSYSSSVDAVVDWFGPVDMFRMRNCDSINDAKSPEAALIGATPTENTEMIDLISPIKYVTSVENIPPFLIIHGDADNVVPYCQSKYFAEVLDQKGALDELVTVPGGQHGPITFNDATFKKMTDFFTKVYNSKKK